MARKDFIRQIQEACTNAVCELGMRRRTLGIASLDVTQDISGQVGLNLEIARHPVSIFVSPFVGIRSEKVHQIIARVKEISFHPYNPPTVVRALGYLMPDRGFLTYEFDSEASIARKVAELAGSIREYALPLFFDCTTLDRLADHLLRWGSWQEVAERLIVIRLLLGASEAELRELSSQVLREGSEQGIAAAKSYPRYLERLFSLLPQLTALRVRT